MEKKEFTDSELKKMKIKENYIIEGILGNKEVTILGAKAKVGKTTLAYAMARAVASGSPFLGHQAKKAKVLYIAMDSNAINMAYVAQQHTDSPIRGIKVLTPDFLNLDELEKQVLAYRYSNKNTKLLVIVDMLINIDCRFYGGQKLQNNGSYADVMQIMQILKHIADQNNLAILVLHHNTKGNYDDPFDNLLGSQGLQGGLQNILILERTEEKDMYKLYVRSRMNSGDTEMLVRRDGGDYIPVEDNTTLLSPSNSEIDTILNYVQLSNNCEVELTASELIAKSKAKISFNKVKQILLQNKEYINQCGFDVDFIRTEEKRVIKIWKFEEI